MKMHVLIVALIGLAGCAQSPTEASFGDAVRAVNKGQVYDHGATIRHGDEAATGADPYRLRAVIEGHRTDASAPQEVQTAITVGVGNSSSSD